MVRFADMGHSDLNLSSVVVRSTPLDVLWTLPTGFGSLLHGGSLRSDGCSLDSSYWIWISRCRWFALRLWMFFGLFLLDLNLSSLVVRSAILDVLWTLLNHGFYSLDLNLSGGVVLSLAVDLNLSMPVVLSPYLNLSTILIRSWRLDIS